MKVKKKKEVKVTPCAHCEKEIIGDPPFSIIRFPMPYYCSMECLEAKEGKAA